MKHFTTFIILSLFSVSLWSADIDTKLYEGNNTISYHSEIAKLIQSEQDLDKNITEEDKERIATERTILEKLTKMLSFKLKVKSLPDSLLSDEQNISVENYFSYLNALTDTYAKIDTYKKEQSTMQAKRKYLKTSINDITSEDKKNLLLYQLQYAFYKVKGNQRTAAIEAFSTLISQGEGQFKQKLKQVTFNIPALEQKLTEINTKLPAVAQETVALNLTKEKNSSIVKIFRKT